MLTKSNTGPYLIKHKHLELIDSLKTSDPILEEAYITLINGADTLLHNDYKYVSEKIYLPPSGNKHDYMSLHRYSYPNSEGVYTIVKDGQTNSEINNYDRPKLSKMSASVYTLAMAYYYSREEKYAQKASEIIVNWFLNPETLMNPNMNYSGIRPGVSEGNGSGLVEARDFIKVIEAVSLIYDSPHWTPDQHLGLKTWFNLFYQWMRNYYALDTHQHSNASTWGDVQRGVFLLFTEQGEKLNSNSHIQPVSERIRKQIEPDGYQPYEATRGTPEAYVQLNLSAYMNLAQLRKNQYSRLGYDRDWPVLENCTLNSCEEGGLKAALDDIADSILDKKKINLFSTQLNYDHCEYLDVYRPAAIVFEHERYEQVVQYLFSEGCRHPDISLTYPPLDMIDEG